MKNKLNVVLAILWFLIALFLCWLLFSKLSTGSNHFTFNAQFSDKVFGNDGITLSFDDLSIGEINTLYKSYPFSTANIEDFNVSTVSESVHFQLYEGSGYLVELYGNWNDKLEPEVTLENKTLKIKTPAVRTGWKNLGSRKIIIKVPESESSRLFDGNISTVSGSIYTSEVCYKEFNAETVSGSIHASGSCKSIYADSTSGSIHISGTCGDITAESTSGSVHVESDEPLTGRNSLESISGSIHISIPEGDGFEFEWNTVSGSVKNDFYNGKCGKSGSQIIGNGNTRINADTVSGSIHLNRN